MRYIVVSIAVIYIYWFNLLNNTFVKLFLFRYIFEIVQDL